jgi:CRP-like cAMP-binding protein
MLQNEEPIKKMMLQLKQFSFLKQFEYHELLYLAHFIQKHKMPAYKEYLFSENYPADYVYFIEEGEFQVFKNAPELTLTKDKSLKKIKRPRQTSPLNKFLEN